MASISLTDTFFNSLALSLYNYGPIEFAIPEINMISNGVLAAFGLPKGLVQVEFCEVPAVSITAKSGLSVVLRAKAQSLEEAAGGKHVLVMCELDVKVDFEDNRLILVSKTIKCEVKPQTMTGKMLKRIAGRFIEKQIKHHLKKWIEGLIPGPDGIDITEGKIEYNDGSVVLSGDLNFTSVITKNLKDLKMKFSDLKMPKENMQREASGRQQWQTASGQRDQRESLGTRNPPKISNQTQRRESFSNDPKNKQQESESETANVNEKEETQQTPELQALERTLKKVTMERDEFRNEVQKVSHQLARERSKNLSERNGRLQVKKDMDEVRKQLAYQIHLKQFYIKKLAEARNELNDLKKEQCVL